MPSCCEAVTNKTKKTNNTPSAAAPGAKTAPGAIPKKRRFPNIWNQAFFRRFVKSLPFGSDLGQAGEWGGFAQIREVINLGQLEAFTKEIRHFRNIYVAKTADQLVGVSGFEPEASWTRIRPGMKIIVICVH